MLQKFLGLLADIACILLIIITLPIWLFFSVLSILYVLLQLPYSIVSKGTVPEIQHTFQRVLSMLLFFPNLIYPAGYENRITQGVFFAGYRDKKESGKDQPIVAYSLGYVKNSAVSSQTVHVEHYSDNSIYETLLSEFHYAKKYDCETVLLPEDTRIKLTCVIPKTTTASIVLMHAGNASTIDAASFSNIQFFLERNYLVAFYAPVKAKIAHDLVLAQEKAVEYIKRHYHHDTSIPITLYGHSIGGSVSMHTAYRLGKEGVSLRVFADRSPISISEVAYQIVQGKLFLSRYIVRCYLKFFINLVGWDLDATKTFSSNLEKAMITSIAGDGVVPKTASMAYSYRKQKRKRSAISIYNDLTLVPEVNYSWVSYKKMPWVYHCLLLHEMQTAAGRMLIEIMLNFSSNKPVRLIRPHRSPHTLFFQWQKGRQLCHQVEGIKHTQKNTALERS